MTGDIPERTFAYHQDDLSQNPAAFLFEALGYFSVAPSGMKLVALVLVAAAAVASAAAASRLSLAQDKSD